MVPLLGTEFVPKADFSETYVNFYTPVGSSLEVTEAKARQVEAIAARVPRGALHRRDHQHRHRPQGKIYARDLRAPGRPQGPQRSVDQMSGCCASGCAQCPASPSRTSACSTRWAARSRSSSRCRAPTCRSWSACRGWSPSSMRDDPRPGRPRHQRQARQADGRHRRPARRRLRPGPERRADRQHPAHPGGRPDGGQLARAGRRDLRRQRAPGARGAQARSRTWSACRFATGTNADGSAAHRAPVQVADGAAPSHRAQPDQPARPEPRSRRSTPTSSGRSAGEVSADIRKVLDAHRASRPATATSSAARPRTCTESFGYAVSALALAVVFIYMILASQFRSFLQPLALMTVAAADADRRGAGAAAVPLDPVHVLRSSASSC